MSYTDTGDTIRTGFISLAVVLVVLAIVTGLAGMIVKNMETNTVRQESCTKAGGSWISSTNADLCLVNGIKINPER